MSSKPSIAIITIATTIATIRTTIITITTTSAIAPFAALPTAAEMQVSSRV
jgi:hypothetical protein